MTISKQELNTFLEDPKVQEFLGYKNHTNIFYVLDIREPGHTMMLRWLFDPQGGHGYGDRFFKQLLMSAYLALPNTRDYNSFRHDWDASAIEWKQFGNLLAIYEHYFNDKEHIDIILYDRDNELMIFIENKLNANHDHEQLLKYDKLINIHFKHIKYKLKILLQCDPEPPDGIPKPWIGLGFDWLFSSFCNEGKHSDRIISDYIEWIKSELSYDQSDRQKQSALSISTKHDRFLKNISNEPHNLTYIYKRLHMVQTVDRIDIDLAFLYARHEEKIDYLLEFSKWEHFGEYLKNSIDESLEYSTGRDGKILQLQSSYWRDYCTQEDSRYWLYIDIRESKGNIESENYKPEIIIKLIVFPEKIIEKYRVTLLRKFNNTRSSKRSTLLTDRIDLQGQSQILSIDEIYRSKIESSIRKIINQVNECFQ